MLSYLRGIQTVRFPHNTVEKIRKTSPSVVYHFNIVNVQNCVKHFTKTLWQKGATCLDVEKYCIFEKTFIYSLSSFFRFQYKSKICLIIYLCGIQTVRFPHNTVQKMRKNFPSDGPMAFNFDIVNVKKNSTIYQKHCDKMLQRL